jgi:hypothetical protein
VILINKFFKIPELFELCQLHKGKGLRLAQTRSGKTGIVKLYGIHCLALYEGQRTTGKTDTKDYMLPDLGQVKLKTRPGRKQLTLVTLAGNNGVPHNHNDIGSFVVARNGQMLLTDPGAPVYSRNTFDDSVRYTILFCRSRGHSVPIINGREQEYGARYYGTLKVEDLNGPGAKRAFIDMSKAYPHGLVKGLVRVFTLDIKKHILLLEDTFTFKRTPRKLEEAFITFQKVKVAAHQKSVQIGPQQGGLRLMAEETAGRFKAERLVAESKEGRTDGVITRITFVPRKLSTHMRLTFKMY